MLTIDTTDKCTRLFAITAWGGGSAGLARGPCLWCTGATGNPAALPVHERYNCSTQTAGAGVLQLCSNFQPDDGTHRLSQRKPDDREPHGAANRVAYAQPNQQSVRQPHGAANCVAHAQPDGQAVHRTERVSHGGSNR